MFQANDKKTADWLSCRSDVESGLGTDCRQAPLSYQPSRPATARKFKAPLDFRPIQPAVAKSLYLVLARAGWILAGGPRRRLGMVHPTDELQRSGTNSALRCSFAVARPGISDCAPRSWIGESTPVTIKCPSCSSTDWLSVAHGKRHYLRCRECGQIKFLPVRKPASEPVQSLAASLVDLFPAADSPIGSVII